MTDLTCNLNNNCCGIFTCCPWNHGLQEKKKQLLVSVAVSPVSVWVPSQRPLAPSVAVVTLVANDKVDYEMILGAVHRSPGICLTAEENPRKPQLGDCPMKGLCDQSSPQMGSFHPNEVRRIAQNVRKG